MADDKKPIINRPATAEKDLTPDQLEQHKKILILKKEASMQAELAYRTKLHNIYLEASAHKDDKARNWDTFMAFYRGTQWPARMPKYKVSAVMNYLVENIERKTALLTDSKPIPKIVPYKDNLQDTADVLNRLISLIFEDGSFSQSKVDLLEYAQVVGSGFIGTLYDRTARHNTGGVKVTNYDPRAVYFDPLVLKSYLLSEGEFVIIEDIWPIEKARDVFPQRADMFRPDVGLSRFEPNQGPGLFRAMISRVFKAREENLVKSEIPRVHVREFWLKDRSRDQDGNPNFKNFARKSITVGDIIADDGENPYDDGDFPIDMYSWHTDFHTAWGWGDIELLKNPQELLNKITAIIVENLMLSSNAIWIGDADALSKEGWKKLNNAPGSYVQVKPGRILRREAGLHFPEYVLKMLDHEKNSMDTMSGMVDVMRGIRTGQVSSGVAVESLQLMAQALIRLRSRALEAMDVRIGRKLISRIFQYYEPQTIIELLKLNEEDEMIKTYTTDLLKPINRRGKEWMHDFMFSVEPGSSLGLAKEQRKQEAFKLRELQVIDDEALLEALEYPNRKKIISRTDKKRSDAQNEEVAGQSPANQGGKAKQFPNQARG